MLTVFQQAVQLIAIALGFGFLNEFAAIAAFEAVQDLIWKLLLSMAFIYMAGPCAVAAGQRRDVRRVAENALLRHVPAEFNHAL